MTEEELEQLLAKCRLQKEQGMLKETVRDEVACIKMVRSKVLILLLGPYSTWILTLSVYRLSQWWTVGLHPRSFLDPYFIESHNR